MAWYRCGGTTKFLFEADDLIPNTYINTAGQPISYNGWAATDFIEVAPNEVLNCAVSDRQEYNCWYDENQTFITNFRCSTMGYSTIQAPSNAHYVRFSSYTQNMENSIRFWR
jgi:hypothetical protein